MTRFTALLERRPWRTAAIVSAVVALTVALQWADLRPAETQNLVLFAYEADTDPGLDPNHRVWERATPVQVPLSGQAAAYAAGGGSVPVVTARALHYRDVLYLLLEWEDGSENASAYRPEEFADAAAVQFPAQAATSVPSFCMGQPGAGVNIWHWRADSQQPIPDPATKYPNTHVDTYPSTEDLFFAARAVGNPYAVAGGPVQNLVAQAFGTLTPAADQTVAGHGVYEDGKWRVVVARPFATADPEQATFARGIRTDVAFAVWDGAKGERDGMKSVSQFITLSIAGAPLPGGGGTNWPWVAAALALFLGLSAIGLVLGWFGYREARRGR